VAIVRVQDVVFNDGDSPPAAIVSKWHAICDSVFASGNPKRNTIAIHCIAGLGRTPVMVAISLIDAGMEPEEAVQAIRKVRRGAINAKQLQFVVNYTPRKFGGGCCVVS
jgi:protein tyrosine phosphatase type IVA